MFWLRLHLVSYVTGSVFEKPGKEILQNVTWLKEFNRVNFYQRPDSI